MGSVLLRPNAFYEGVGQTGAVTAVADQSDSTWMAWVSGGQIRYGFENLPTLPAGIKIKSVRLSYRTQSSSGISTIASRLHINVNTGNYLSSGGGSNVGTAVVQKVSPTWARNPDGNVWVPANINTLSAVFFLGENMRINDIWVDVIYTSPPVGFLTAPTGSYTSSVRPVFAWDYEQVDGIGQERYRLKVFTDTQFTASGFNVETSTALWDSGEVWSATDTVTCPVNLANGVAYRAFLKVGDAGSNGRWSTWNLRDFTISVTDPGTGGGGGGGGGGGTGGVLTTPTLAVIGNADTSVTLTVTGTATGRGVVVERSDSDGPFLPVRGSYAWYAPNSTFVGTDYEAPLNQTTRYRAWQWSADTFDNLFASPPTPVQTVLVPNNVLRLKDPSIPGLQLKISLRDNFEVSSPRLEGVYAPLGSPFAVVLVDSTPGGDVIPLPLQFKTDADYRLFKALRATGHVLLLCTDTVDQWYVQLTDDAQTTTQMSAVRKSRPYRTVDITARQVAPPVDLTPPPPG